MRLSTRVPGAKSRELVARGEAVAPSRAAKRSFVHEELAEGMSVLAHAFGAVEGRKGPKGLWSRE